MTAEPAVQRILVVAAHPDDIDFSAAGSIARWTSEGVEVHYCLCTDGDAGGSDESITREEMGHIRRAEQTAAAAELGVSEVHFLGHPDGRLYVTHELRRDITRVIRRVRPQRVLVPSPDRVPAPCEYAGPGACGGCDWQHASLPAQREIGRASCRERV